MTKRVFILLLLCSSALSLRAQWKITGWDKSSCDNVKLIQIIDLDSATFLFGTLSNNTDEAGIYSVNRKACIMVDGIKYKLLNSVNVPVQDEATPKWVRLDEPGQKVNFVMEFEKFPVKEGFDFIENEKDQDAWNICGIHLEQIEPTALIKTKRFINAYPVVTYGNFTVNGINHIYFIRDGVSIDCHCTRQENIEFFRADHNIFDLNIINESDHGIRFDFEENVYVSGHRKKNDGTVETVTIKKFIPEQYEEFLAWQDYEVAKYDTNPALAILGSRLNSASYSVSNDEWSKAGFAMLSSLDNQIMKNDIQEYLRDHPRENPSAMKTQSIPAGSTYSGYVAAKTKNVDYFILHIKMDDYDFQFMFKH